MNEPYTIAEIKKGGNNFTVQVSVNWAAEIFKGHFPDVPMFPGALFLRICSEAMGKACDQENHFEFKDCKFLKPVTQEFDQLILNFELKEGHYSITCEEPKTKAVVFKGKLLLT